MVTVSEFREGLQAGGAPQIEPWSDAHRFRPPRPAAPTRHEPRCGKKRFFFALAAWSAEGRAHDVVALHGYGKIGLELKPHPVAAVADVIDL